MQAAIYDNVLGDNMGLNCNEKGHKSW